MFHRHIATLVVAAFALSAGPAGASWTLLDDFEGYSVGQNIDGLNGWRATGTQIVQADPGGFANQALRVYDSNRDIYKAATVADGDTGTLFFRFYIPAGNSVDFGVGTTVIAAPNDGTTIADYFRFNGSSLQVHHGGWRTVGGFSNDAWYNVWNVIDNDSDTWQAYVEGPGFTGQEQLVWGSTADFDFRYGDGANDLVNFYMRTNNAHGGEIAYVDDIYLHATAADLLHPMSLHWAPGADTGGTGEWNTTDASWEDWSGVKHAWPEAAPFSDAVFGGTAGTVTIDAAGVSADRIRFTATGYEIDGGPLMLAGDAPTVTVAPGTAATIAAPIAGNDGLTNAGAGTLTLAGGNTYTGLTTISGGELRLDSDDTAVPGDLLITSGAKVRFYQNNQIADTATVVMRDSGSTFNGVGMHSGYRSNHQETIGSLEVTGGSFNIGGRSEWAVAGKASFTGGDGNTGVLVHSGSSISFGGLSLTAMTSDVPQSANSFVIYGNQTNLTTVSVGGDGLTLDGSLLLMRRATSSGGLGSTLFLDGDLTTTGDSASEILLQDGTYGECTLRLSSTAGTFTRTFHIGGGANLAISVDITTARPTPRVSSRPAPARWPSRERIPTPAGPRSRKASCRSATAGSPDRLAATSSTTRRWCSTARTIGPTQATSPAREPCRNSAVASSCSPAPTRTGAARASTGAWWASATSMLCRPRGR